MKRITIPEAEYLQMQQTIHTLQQQLTMLKDESFLAKLNLAYHLFTTPTTQTEGTKTYKPVSLKRGSAKKLITFIADDFTAPLDDFNEYM